jgi:hypothetical protein
MAPHNKGRDSWPLGIHGVAVINPVMLSPSVPDVLPNGATWIFRRPGWSMVLWTGTMLVGVHHRGQAPPSFTGSELSNIPLRSHHRATISPRSATDGDRWCKASPTCILAALSQADALFGLAHGFQECRPFGHEVRVPSGHASPYKSLVIPDKVGWIAWQ